MIRTCSPIENLASQRTCAICGGELREPLALQLRDYNFRICAECRGWTCLPRPNASEQAAIHDNYEYFDHPYFALRRHITPAQRQRCRSVIRALSPAADLASLRGQRFLDVGCDTGVFLKVAQEELGIVPVGLDVSKRAVEAARRHGIEAYQSTLEDAPPELSNFAAATAIDLIEHVSDPVSFLSGLRSRLRPGGVVYLETPNIRSMVYHTGKVICRIGGGRPAGLMRRLFPPQHIQYFTADSLRRLAARAGLDIASIFTRVLPGSHVSASAAALIPILALQSLDRLLGTEILLCAVLRRPSEESRWG
jgi:2-polyprenyl-3-methyl-5-hydroxy-6-metoxy-1,4-benzoquinol methylase